jgi:hypothetical protein
MFQQSFFSHIVVQDVWFLLLNWFLFEIRMSFVYVLFFVISFCDFACVSACIVFKITYTKRTCVAFYFLKSSLCLIVKWLSRLGFVVRVVVTEIDKMGIGLLIFHNQAVLNIQQHSAGCELWFKTPAV